jgi:hypothetical protein
VWLPELSGAVQLSNSGRTMAVQAADWVQDWESGVAAALPTGGLSSFGGCTSTAVAWGASWPV